MTLILSRRVVLSCGGMVPLCPAAWATPEDASKSTSLAGQLLVATDAMGDPRFRHSVILLAKHDKMHVFPIRVPTLRERSRDIPLLVRYFVQKFCKRLNKRVETIPAEAMKALEA